MDVHKEKKTDWTFRKLAPGDEPELTRLFKLVFKEEVRDDAYWTWKYLENRWGESYSYVAFAEGRIVGFVGGMAWQLSLKGKIFGGAQVTDLMMEPAWRRKGLFFPLNQQSQKEIFERASWHYGVTNPVSFKIFQKRYGYKGFRPNKIQKILDVRPFLREMVRNRKNWTLPKPGAVLRRLLPSRGETMSQSPTDADIRIVPVQAFDDRYDALWSRIHEGLGLATTRDRAYLTWRYLKNPRYAYTVLAAEQGDTLAGFVVLRQMKEGGIRRGFIVDFLADPNCPGTDGRLIESAVQFFRKSRVAVVNTWMFEHSASYAAFHARGFAPRKAETVMILTNSLTDAFSKEYMADVSNWYFSMGDCEVF